MHFPRVIFFQLIYITFLFINLHLIHQLCLDISFLAALALGLVSGVRIFLVIVFLVGEARCCHHW